MKKIKFGLKLIFKMILKILILIIFFTFFFYKYKEVKIYDNDKKKKIQLNSLNYFKILNYKPFILVTFLLLIKNNRKLVWNWFSSS